MDLQLEKARQESNNITDELIVANETKYNLLKDYIQVQYDETANMQHIIDLLTEETHILAAADIERAQMVSETLRNKSGLLAQEWNQRTINSIRTEDASIVESDALSESSHALTRRVQRLAADISGASPSTAETEIAIASGYSPNFE